MLKKVLAAASALVFSLSANAGLITDTDNDSFIDETTGLEWMDFGINNNLSFDYVSSQLDVGGDFYGWRLPNTDEVYGMMINAFTGFPVDYIDPVNFTIRDGRNEVGSAFTSIFEAMGYNDTSSPSGSFREEFSDGLFNGIHGLSKVNLHAYTGSLADLYFADEVNIADHSLLSLRSNSTYSHTSTLLVANSIPATSVPEPSTFAIFSLAMLGLVSRKLKK